MTEFGAAPSGGARTESRPTDEIRSLSADFRAVLETASAQLDRIDALLDSEGSLSAAQVDAEFDAASRDYCFRMLLGAMGSTQGSVEDALHRSLGWAREGTDFSTHALGRILGVSATSISRWQQSASRGERAV